MKILLDECLPRKLKYDISGHDVVTVPEMGWAHRKNGELLQLAIGSAFDVFVTADQNLHYLQNLRDAEIAVISMVAPNNRLETLRPLIADVLAALQIIQAGDYVEISAQASPGN